MAQKSQKTGVSKFTKWIWRIFIGGLIFLFLIFLLASLGVFGKLPTFEELENPENNLATEVISIDGVTLGKYYRENRTPVKFKELPTNLDSSTRSLRKMSVFTNTQALILKEPQERLHKLGKRRRCQYHYTAACQNAVYQKSFWKYCQKVDPEG